MKWKRLTMKMNSMNIKLFTPSVKDMSKDLSPKMQNLIKDILANDQIIKKAKKYEKKDESDKESDNETIEDEETEENSLPPLIPRAPAPEVKRRQRKPTKKEKKDALAKEYLEEVALGNLKYKDSANRNRTRTLKSYIKEKQNPKYNAGNKNWTVTELFTPKILAMKTVGSLIMKNYKCTLKEMQKFCIHFLNQLSYAEFEDMKTLLETPNIGIAACNCYEEWAEGIKDGSIEEEKLKSISQRKAEEETD